MTEDIILTEDQRRKLDSIVQKMIANNESDEDIRFVVNDFKSIYGVKKKESTPSESESGSITSKSGWKFPTQESSNQESYFTQTFNKGLQKPVAKVAPEGSPKSIFEMDPGPQAPVQKTEFQKQKERMNKVLELEDWNKMTEEQKTETAKYNQDQTAWEAAKSKPLDKGELFTFLDEDQKKEASLAASISDASSKEKKYADIYNSTNDPSSRSLMMQSKYDKDMATQKYKSYMTELYKSIDEQIAVKEKVLSSIPEGVESGATETLKSEIEALNKKKDTFFKNKDAQIVQTYTEVASEIKKFNVPGNTPQEKIENYAKLLREKAQKIWDEYGGMSNQTTDAVATATGQYGYLQSKSQAPEPSAVDAWKRAFGASGVDTETANKKMDELAQIDQQLRAIAPVVLINKANETDKPYDYFDTGAKGIVRGVKSFARGLTGGFSGALANPEEKAQSLLTSINDANLMDSVTDSNKKSMEQRSKGPSMLGFEGLMSTVGTSLAIVPYIEAGAFMLGTARAIPAVTAALDALAVSKYGRYLVNHSRATSAMLESNKVASAIQAGVEMSIAGDIAPKGSAAAEDANFMSGLIGKFGEQLAGSAINTLATSDAAEEALTKMFGGASAEARALITSLGKRVGGAVGETVQEYGESVGSFVKLYMEKGNWADVKKEIDNQFGTVDKNVEFAASSFIMGFTWGRTGLGKAAMDLYNKGREELSPSDQAILDRFTNDVYRNVMDAEVVAKVEAINQNPAAANYTPVTPQDLDKKDAALEIIQSTTATQAEKVEAARILAEINGRQKQEQVTKAAQALMSDGEQVQTPTEGESLMVAPEDKKSPVSNYVYRNGQWNKVTDNKTEAIDATEQKEVQEFYDSQNKSRISSQVRIGEESVKAQPVEGSSAQETGTSGDVQTSEKIRAKIQSITQRISDIKEARDKGVITEESTPAGLKALKDERTALEKQLTSTTESELQTVSVEQKTALDKMAGAVKQVARSLGLDLKGESKTSAMAKAYNAALNVPLEQRTKAQTDLIKAVDAAVKTSTKATPTTGGVNASNKAQISALEGRVTNNAEKAQVVSAAKKAINTLKSIFPDMDIFVHETDDSYDAVMSEYGTGTDNTAGNFAYYTKDGKATGRGRIDINLNKATKTSVAHEVTHAVLLKAFGDNTKLYKDFRDRMSKIISSDLNEELSKFEKKYEGQEVAPEEYLVELSAILSANKETIQNNKTLMGKIAKLINEFVSKITNGKIKPFEGEASFDDFVDFINQISGAISEGNAIDKLMNGQAYGESLAVEVPTDFEPVRELSSKSQKVAIGDYTVPADIQVLEMANLPIATLKDKIKEYNGRVIIITSDATGYGVDSKGEPILGGPGFAGNKKNVLDGVGFASLNEGTVKGTYTRAENAYGEGPTLVLIMMQPPHTTINNSYGAKYMMRGLMELAKDNPKEFTKAIDGMKEFVSGSTAIQNMLKAEAKKAREAAELAAKKKEVQKLIKKKEAGKELTKDELAEIKKYETKLAKAEKANTGEEEEVVKERASQKALFDVLDSINADSDIDELVKEFLDVTTFNIRKDFGLGILLEHENVQQNKGTTYSKTALNKIGYNIHNFLKEYGDNTILTEDMIMNNRGGFVVGGFEIDVTSPDKREALIKETQEKGIVHPLFNAKLPGTKHFRLDAPYPVQDNFGKYAVPDRVIDNAKITKEQVDILVRENYKENSFYKTEDLGIPMKDRTYTNLKPTNKSKFKKDILEPMGVLKDKAADVATKVAKGEGFIPIKGAQEAMILDEFGVKYDELSPKAKVVVKKAATKKGKMLDSPEVLKSKSQIIGEVGARKLENAEVVMNNLYLAKTLEQEKKTPRQIRLATGWERGADLLWRYEIPYGKLKPFDIDKLPAMEGDDSRRYAKLSDILDAPELFKLYDNLNYSEDLGGGLTSTNTYDSTIGDVTVVFDKNLKAGTGYYNKYDNEIAIASSPITNNDDVNKILMYRTLIHETQHYVQMREGFEGGGSSASMEPRLEGAIKNGYSRINLAKNVYKAFEAMKVGEKELKKAKADVDKRVKELDDFLRIVNGPGYNSSDFDQYIRLSGEQEATNAANRAFKMTPEQRLNKTLATTESVRRGDQIVLEAFAADALRQRQQQKKDFAKSFKAKIKNTKDLSPEAKVLIDKGLEQDGPMLDSKEVLNSKSQIVGVIGAKRLENASVVMKDLDLAKSLEASKKTPRQIKLLTGWERGTDLLWRYELPYGKLKSLDIKKLPVIVAGDKSRTFTKLSDILDAPELLKAYGEKTDEKIMPHSGLRTKFYKTNIADVTVVFDDNVRPGEGYFDMFDNQIVLSSDPKDRLQVLIHEVQHYVQMREDFEDGSSPASSQSQVWNVDSELMNRVREAEKNLETIKMIKDLSYEKTMKEELSRVKKQLKDFRATVYSKGLNAWDWYERNAGETEARNAAKRSMMSPEKRLTTTLAKTEDIAKKDQIVLNAYLFDDFQERINQKASYGPALKAVDKYENAEGSEKDVLKSKAQVAVFKDTKFLPVGFWVDKLKGKTEYLDSVIESILKSREELKKGEVSKDKVVKAYLVTLASMGSGGGYYKNWSEKQGVDVSDVFLEDKDGKQWIRPEGAAAAYLITPQGKQLVKDVVAGNATEAQIRDMFLFVGVGRENSKAEYVAKTLADGGIDKMTKLFNENKGSDFEALYNGAIGNLEGIGEGKTGFFNQYFGVSNRGVIDARQLNAWISGSMKLNEEQTKLKKKVEGSEKLGKELLDRIQAVGEALGYPKDLAGYIAHHAIWDGVNGSITTHKGEYEVINSKSQIVEKLTPKLADKQTAVMLRRAAGLITHNGAETLTNLDPSKIKGSVRGRYGKGFYFSNLYKSYDYGDKSTYLNEKPLNLIDGNISVLKALNSMESPSDILSQINKLETAQSKVKNNKDYNEVSNEIKLLKDKYSKFDQNSKYIINTLKDLASKNPDQQFADVLESLEARVIESNRLDKMQAVKGLEESMNNLLLQSGFDGVNVDDGREIMLIPQDKLNDLIVPSQEDFIAEAYQQAKEDGSNPKLVKEVDNAIGELKSKSQKARNLDTGIEYNKSEDITSLKKAINNGLGKEVKLSKNDVKALSGLELTVFSPSTVDNVNTNVPIIIIKKRGHPWDTVAEAVEYLNSSDSESYDTLSDYFEIVDGRHRIKKAISSGTGLNAVVVTEMDYEKYTGAQLFSDRANTRQVQEAIDYVYDNIAEVDTLEEAINALKEDNQKLKTGRYLNEENAAYLGTLTEESMFRNYEEGNPQSTFAKAIDLFYQIRETEGATKKRRLADERKALMDANPSVKYIDDNIKNILDQLEKNNKATRKGNCP